LSPSAGSSLEFTVKEGDDEKTMSAKALKPGVWTHIAATVSGERGKLYVDGECVREVPAMAIQPSDLATTLNYVGRARDDGLPCFKGQVFDARFLTDELTTQAVRELAARIALNFDDKSLRFSVSVGMGLTGSLAGSAKGGEGALSYSKAAGPEWLKVHPDGRLEGRPLEPDEGENTFTHGC
jgi:hypothetical protein